MTEHLLGVSTISVVFVEEHIITICRGGGLWTKRMALEFENKGFNISLSPNIKKIKAFRRLENGVHHPLIQNR